jgi:peptidoglycan/xylan/chitin deacetylase (PgdA/CDA1 family)
MMLREFITRFVSVALFAALLSVPLAAQTPTPVRTVAITFDDLPHADAGHQANPATLAAAAEANRKILAALKRFRAPATGFANESHIRALGAGAERILAGWNRGDYELANHSFSHADANTLDSAGIEREIVQGEATIGPLAQRAGRRLRFYRFPYNHLGDTAAKQSAALSYLTGRGYSLAASTIDTSDYIFDNAFERALRERDKPMQERIRRTYLAHTATQIAYYAGLNRQALGFEPPAIMLLHINRLNAATLAAQLALFRQAGYRFVSLAEAQSHPVYAEPPRWPTRFGSMWGYRWARERRVMVDGSREEEPPGWVVDYGAGKAVAPSGK